MKHITRTTALAGAALLALTACGVTPDDTYSDAESLASALDSEGFRCDPVGEPITIADGYGNEVQCHTDMSVSVWDAELPEHAEDPGLMFALGGQMTGRHYVLHDTWAVAVARDGQAEAISEIFGGELVGPNRDLMDILDG